MMAAATPAAHAPQLAYDVMMDEDKAVVLPCRHTEEGVPWHHTKARPMQRSSKQAAGSSQPWLQDAHTRPCAASLPVSQMWRSVAAFAVHSK